MNARTKELIQQLESQFHKLFCADWSEGMWEYLNNKMFATFLELKKELENQENETH